MEKQIWKRKRPLLQFSLSQETADLISTLAVLYKTPKSRVVDEICSLLKFEDIINHFNIKKEK